MQNERIKTEEHIEYDSDDTPDSGKKNALAFQCMCALYLRIAQIRMYNKLFLQIIFLRPILFF